MINNAYILFHGLRAPGEGFFGGFDQAIQDSSGNSDKEKLCKHRGSNFGYSATYTDFDN